MGELNTTPGGLILLGGRLCLDFCNTVTRRSPPRDMLAEGRFEALLEWSKELALISPEIEQRHNIWAASHPEPADALFEEAAQLREAIFQVGLSAIAGESMPDESVAALNHWAQQAMLARHLSPSPVGKLEWQWRDANAPERPLWEIALSAVDVFLKEDLARLRQCPGCGWLFYDQSKNNTRMWCDMRFCGNRAKNKRFHGRQKQADE